MEKNKIEPLGILLELEEFIGKSNNEEGGKKYQKKINKEIESFLKEIKFFLDLGITEINETKLEEIIKIAYFISEKEEVEKKLLNYQELWGAQRLVKFFLLINKILLDESKSNIVKKVQVGLKEKMTKIIN